MIIWTWPFCCFLKEARPRGRGALFKQAASLASTSSSGAGQGDADRKTVVSDTTFESGTALTEFSSGSGSDEPRKGRGRAAMFSQTTPSLVIFFIIIFSFSLVFCPLHLLWIFLFFPDQVTLSWRWNKWPWQKNLRRLLLDLRPKKRNLCAYMASRDNSKFFYIQWLRTKSVSVGFSKILCWNFSR